jgi:WD40 repeat protein
VIMDVKNDQMKILSKLKSHEDSINCLCWLPIKPETSEIEARIKSSLSVSDLSQILCSSSEDKTIRLWCTAQGVQLKCLKAPGVTSNVTTGQSASKKQGASGQLQTPAKINYTPLCWPSAQHIVSGSFK